MRVSRAKYNDKESNIVAKSIESFNHFSKQMSYCWLGREGKAGGLFLAGIGGKLLEGMGGAATTGGRDCDVGDC